MSEKKESNNSDRKESKNLEDKHAEKRKSLEPESKSPSKTMKFSFSSSKPNLKDSVKLNSETVAPIKISLGGQKPVTSAPLLKKASNSVAQAFNPDSDSDEEEIPAEAKMRMKNLGRETPTAAGPNSFGKGRLGFCDRQGMIERQIRDQAGDT